MTRFSQIRNIDYDVPEFKKCFFCFPIKQALTIWGFLLAISITIITVVAIHNYVEIYFKDLSITLMFAFTMVVSIIELTMALFIIYSSAKSNWQYLNICYNYSLVKIVVYIILLVVSVTYKLCCYSENWYYYHLDPARYYMLRENPVAGVMECVLLAYMALVMRSHIQQLGGTPHCLYSGYTEPDTRAFIASEFFYPEIKTENPDNYDKQTLYTVS